MNTQNTATTLTDLGTLPLGTRLLRRREVELKTGKSRSSIYADIQEGTFPAPVSIGKFSVAWVEAEIEQWITDRITQRNECRGNSPVGSTDNSTAPRS